MNRLKELRQEKKLSQKELAENIGVHYRTLQNWEKGERQIKPEKAQQLADIFGESVGYILGYELEGMTKRSIYEEVYSALLRVKSENPNHDDRVAIREVCMELIEATLEGVLMKERLILKFELNRKQMINSNDRPHFHQKAKITKFLRKLAEYEGKNVLRDYFGLPYSEDKPCKVKVRIYPPTNRKYDPPNWSPTSKALFDGLTDAKIWTDDNYNVIVSTEFMHGGKSGNKNYRIELEIYEYHEILQRIVDGI